MVLLLVASLAGAQDIAGTEEAGQAFEENEATLSAELGGSLTTGNTQFYNISAGIVGGYKAGKNKIGFSASALYGESIVDALGDGVVDDDDRAVGYQVTAQRVLGDLRYDRFLGEKISGYFLVGALRDKFAGYDLRTHEQIGISYLFVKNDTTSLVGEFGFDWAQENFIEGVDPNYQDVFAARIMGGFSHNFNENVGFSDTLEVFPNVVDLEDIRLLNQAAISAKLSDIFSLRFSHDLTFDNQPVEGFRPLDQTVRATIVASIL